MFRGGSGTKKSKKIGGEYFMKKVLCIMLAVMMLGSMSLTAFANSYNTTVTYDISTGKASLVTSGTADAGKEVTHIIYKDAEPTKDTILYVDQTTADDNGAFSFSYSVAAEKMANVSTATAIVGTDGEAVNFGETDSATTKVAGYYTVNVTVEEGLTVTAAGVTVDASDVIYVAPNANVSFNVTGSEKYTYTLNSDAAVEKNVATFELAFAANSTLAFAKVVVPEDSFDFDTNWGTDSEDEIAYETVITKDLKAEDLEAPVTYTKPENADLAAELEAKGVKEGSKQVSVFSTIAPEAEAKGVEFGILFTTANIADESFVADVDGVYVLTAHASNSEGAWGINVIDAKGEMTGYKARTYVKAKGIYKYGTIISK